MIRVLIIEDDPMVADINRMYLDQIEGFALAAIARNFEEAMLRISEESVDLILLDIFLPGRNGLDVLAELRARLSEVDVIPVTAACDMKTIQTALQLGAVDYLIKPFEFKRFRQSLENYRKKRTKLRSIQVVNQAELDSLLHQGEAIQANEPKGLPKGLDRKTLLKIWTAVQERGAREFTTEDITFEVGLSRVSTRKYLEFMEEAGILTMNVVYGSVGRPVHRYRLEGGNRQRMDHYL